MSVAACGTCVSVATGSRVEEILQNRARVPAIEELFL